MKVIIMAGGRGTRISKLFPNIPKPMIPIKDKNGIEKPVLEWEIKSLVEQGFTDVILTVSYMADKIKDYFGTGERFGCHIEYWVEEIPLGNAGALFKMRDTLRDTFLLLNADAMFDIDFKRMVEYHKSREGLVTLFTHPNSHPFDSGVIISDDTGTVVSWLAKEDVRPKYYKNRVNAGLHVIEPKALGLCEISADDVGREENGKIVKVDLDRQVLKPLCGRGVMYCYDSPEYCKDMGTPERYEQVSHDFQMGIVDSKNLSNQQRAIFLDRDGTINKYVGFLRDIDEFELLDGIAEAIKIINASGYLTIVVTNQPVIARGEVTIEELKSIHYKMETLLGEEGAYIDDLYYCPHHPHKGFAGEVEELKIECNCRKPNPGLLLKAAEDYNIDLSNSWMIGDGENDVKAGKNAGCRTIILQDSDKETYGADVVARNLLEAVGILLNNFD